MTQRDLVYSMTWGNLLVCDSERPSGIQYDLGETWYMTQRDLVYSMT